MNRIVAWYYRKELAARDESAYNRGYRVGCDAVLEAMRRTKVVLFGAAPVAGLNDFLARTPALDVSIIGCEFGSGNS